MDCKKSILALFWGLFVFLTPLYAQVITLDEFLDQLIETHPIIEKEDLTARIEEEGRNGLLGAQDWNLESSLIFSDLSISGPVRTDATTLSTGFERLFWKTGGRFSTSMTFNRTELHPALLYSRPSPYYENQFAITYIQPLLQNRNGFLDRIQYELTRYDIDFSNVQAKENKETFLAESAAKFLEWVFLTEQNDIITQRLSLSKEALENTRKKRKVNLVDEVDVLRAEDAVRIANQSLVLSESQWRGLQAELAVLAQDEDIYNLVPRYDLYSLKVLAPLDSVIAQIEENSRLVYTLDIRIRQLEYSRSGFAESIKPRLSLLAQFNLRRADSRFDDALALDKPDIIGGLQLDFPLGNTYARSNVEKSDLQIAQLRWTRDKLILDLSAAITNITIQLEEMQKILALNREQIESAKDKTAEELKLYNQGRNDFTFVIQSQDGEQNARLNYALNALTYHKLIIEYMALTDALYE